MPKQSTNFGIVVYFLLVILVLYANLYDNRTLGLFVKPLLMPCLIFVVLNQGINKAYRRRIIPALIFSFFGDALLMFQSYNQIYFMLGLVAFLLAHIFYIRFFSKLITSASHPVKKRTIYLWIILFYCAGLYGYLYPTLGSLWWPVLAYAMLISLMLLLSINAYNSVNKKAAVRFVVGALLFVISDSLLAINKFSTPIPYAGFCIMLTYCLAQFYIVKGSLSLYRAK